MTHGHLADETVLEQLAPLSFAYLGMMGSAAKVAGIFERLISRGISKRDLDRVRAPIGLPIGSKTPPEIALSIAAEIIRVKNGL
jgi:xanthine dehydrogenase accessory factor